MPKHLFNSLLLLVLLLGCSSSDDTDTPNPNEETNILLIIADDLGLDALNGYSEGSVKANTPNIDALASNGLIFNNLWTNSVCSPTRATILTGKYGINTGVRSQGDEISVNETSLQTYINQSNEYATAIVGKWHLSGNAFSLDPEDMGIDYYAGLYSGAVSDYYNWNLTEDGNITTETEYVTTKFTTMAIDWVSQQTKPWFLWLAYNAPHTPFHAPPANMHSQGTLATDQASINADPLPYYIASIEAMDFQIGRLLSSLEQAERDNTVIIFIGDNGTPGQVSQAPYGRRKAKGTMYQGGVNTPMIISGKGISRTGTDSNLINSSDLFATIASMSGVSVSEINDSKDLTPLLSTAQTNFREFTYAEYNDGIEDEWAIRNDHYKLIVNTNGSQELYFLDDDPYENNNLLDGTLSSDAQTAFDWLQNKLTEIRQ
ncbi:sulfatase-like hydrolase/transferase [Roseivirga sp. E12]|uniref:sulfatase-like hydrolase/transferase n=1 Tax=Roseivirga sp. E12 TaxID=2819237 RepID=UPI001ABBF26C|nr:sulfatase-like hydrolase/transferase [Roseivirga sp. E12]MBO3697033.1 sulfatase-like hydrolase/transferase [Roseivirga sp. E12]